MRRIVLAAIAALGCTAPENIWAQGAAAPAAFTNSNSSIQPAPATPLGATSTVAATTAGTPYLGMQVNQVANVGLVVAAVFPGSPCERAGVAVNDVVRSFNGQAVLTNDDLTRLVRTTNAAGKWTLVIARGGVDRTIEITPAAQPSSTSPPVATAPSTTTLGVLTPKNRGLGVSIAPVTLMSRPWLRVPDTRGAVVTGVYAGSPAFRAGIPYQAVIVAIDNRPIANPNELRNVVLPIDAGRTVSVKYYHQGLLSERMVTLDPLVGSAASVAATAAVTAPVQSRVAASIPPTSDAAEVRRLEQRVVDLERKLVELQSRVGK